MKAVNYLLAFIGGAAVGAACAKRVEAAALTVAWVLSTSVQQPEVFC